MGRKGDVSFTEEETKIIVKTRKPSTTEASKSHEVNQKVLALSIKSPNSDRVVQGSGDLQEYKVPIKGGGQEMLFLVFF